MNTTNHTTNRLIQWLSFALFFLAGTLYLYFFTAYMFFYQEKATLFLVSFEYLMEHLNRPGGFLTYLGELQAAFYFYPLIGAVLVTLQICGVIYLIKKIAWSLTGRNISLFPFFIGAALFYLQINYRYLAFNNLGVFVSLLLFYLVVKYAKNKYLWLPVLLSPVAYFLLGSFSLVFYLSFLIFLLQKEEWVKFVAVVVLIGIFFWMGKEYFFFQTADSLLVYPFSIDAIGKQIKLLGAAIGLVVLLPLIVQIRWKKLEFVTLKKVGLAELSPFVVIVILTFFVVPRIDKKNSHYFKIQKLFYQQKYEELIAFNTQYPTSNLISMFSVNIALTETGYLSNSLFKFQQDPSGETLFFRWQMLTAIIKRGGYFYYTLGMINEAQRWAYEYMVINGNSPETLKLMIKTDLIKGKYEIAEKYISILEKSIFYRKDAHEFRQFLFNNEAVKRDKELGTKQKFDTKLDFFVQAGNPAANLDLIIEADSTNIPAIEYKLAWLMLQKDMEGVVKLLPVMEQAGYNRIPTNVAEVVAAYKMLKAGELPELQRLKIDKQTETRFNNFYRTFLQYRNNKQQARRVMANEFSDTYWYYVFFN